MPISAVGTTGATHFARCRARTETLFVDHAILRLGLVLADSSFGGSLKNLPIPALILSHLGLADDR